MPEIPGTDDAAGIDAPDHRQVVGRTGPGAGGDIGDLRVEDARDQTLSVSEQPVDRPRGGSGESVFPRTGTEHDLAIGTRHQVNGAAVDQPADGASQQGSRLGRGTQSQDIAPDLTDRQLRGTNDLVGGAAGAEDHLIGGQPATIAQFDALGRTTVLEQLGNLVTNEGRP